VVVAGRRSQRQRWRSGDRVAEAIDEIGEHPGDTVHVRGELLVAGGFEIAKVVRQEQQVIELAGRSLGNRQEPRQFGIAIPAAPLGDIRRNRCGGPSQLVGQPVAFLLREGARLTVHLQRQLVGSLPHPQIAKVPHLAPPAETLTAPGDRSVTGDEQYAANRQSRTSSPSSPLERSDPARPRGHPAAGTRPPSEATPLRVSGASTCR
jgi:hypothetical protein